MSGQCNECKEAHFLKLFLAPRHGAQPTQNGILIGSRRFRLFIWSSSRPDGLESSPSSSPLSRGDARNWLGVSENDLMEQNK